MYIEIFHDVIYDINQNSIGKKCEIMSLNKLTRNFMLMLWIIIQY